MRVFEILLIMAVAAIPFGLLAHGTGRSIEWPVDGYLIDIGYDGLDLEAGRTTRFEFQLLKEDSLKAPEPFDDVWVRFAKSGGGQVIFTGRIHQEANGLIPAINFVFPEGGPYELAVRFEKGGNTVAEALIPLDVLPGMISVGVSGSGGTLRWLFFGFIIGLAAGTLLVLAIRFFRKPPFVSPGVG